MKLKFEYAEVELVDIWYNYLYPYLIRFSIKTNLGIEWKKNEIFISNESKETFKILIREAMQNLLDDCYIEPTQRQRSKHSSSFVKIDFNNKIYIVDYRRNIVGILAFALDYILKIIDNQSIS